MSEVAQLLAALREAARPGIWSTGVKLARAGAVAIASRDANEVVLRVKAPGRPVALTAVLYPSGEEWECDCPGHVDPCEHVVAAAIALQQAEAEGGELATVEQRGDRVVYRLSRVEGGLALQRVRARADGSEVPFERSLAAQLALPGESTRLQVEQCDLLVDRLLERATRGAVPPERLDALLRALEPARNVLLDGRPVAISDEEVMPQVVVEDRGEGIAVSFTRDHRVGEVVSPGVALCGDALCRLGGTEVTGEWLERLPSSRTYGPEQLGELTTRVMPDLARRFPVEMRSKRIPPLDRMLRPRLVLELSQTENQLSALPLLVYGSPPSVRIDSGRMVYLRDAVPLRDEAAEQRLIHQLRDELNLVPGNRSFFQGADRIRFADRLRTWRGELGGDAAKVVSPDVRLRPLFSATASAGEGGIPQASLTLEFRVEGAPDSAAASVDAEAVLRAWSEGLGLVPLLGGGWAPLPRAWLEKHGAQVAELLAARQENGRVANHALPALAALCDALEHPRPPALAKLTSLAEGFEHLPEAALPADLTAELRPYQRLGANWLAFLRSAGVGGVLADDMGLGKTVQALCTLGPRSLVVCPTSVLPNWVAEARRFRPGLKLSVYHGASRALDRTADLTLTSYALLRLDAAALAAVRWDAVVLDEAQAIKNPDSQVAKAAFGLDAGFRLALSGTPIENRLEELWSVMHFVNRGLLGGRSDFESKLARPIAEGSREAAATLRRRIRPFVLRRLKQEVAPELPPKVESILRVELDEAERAVYDGIHAATRAEVVSLLSQGGSVMQALEALLRLRQAACHPGLIPGQHARSSSKMRVLAEALSTAVEEGHRALVFSQWTALLDRIEPELKQAGLTFERLDGSTVDRGAVVERFQAAGGAPIMLISLKAGGTGLNLTAADHVYLVDPWWNPAVEAQAADRAHRLGQERTVFVHRLVSQGTVEERILGLQEKKRALFDAALGDAPSGGLTRDDLLALLA